MFTCILSQCAGAYRVTGRAHHVERGAEVGAELSAATIVQVDLPGNA